MGAWKLDSADLERSIICFDPYHREIKNVIYLVRVREVDGTKHEKGPVPPVFEEICDLGAFALGRDVPDGGDIFDLTRRVLGRRRKEEIRAELFRIEHGSVHLTEAFSFRGRPIKAIDVIRSKLRVHSIVHRVLIEQDTNGTPGFVALADYLGCPEPVGGF